MLDTPITITLIICIFGFLGYLGKLFFMSKCSDVNFLCFKCHRHTSQEQKNVSNMNIDISKALNV